MAKLNDYYQKKRLMEQLANELEKLEEDQAVKRSMEFKDKIQGLLQEYDKSPAEAVEILAIIDPSVASQVRPKSSSPIGPKRAIVTYKNPHTGELIKTRGGNHKVLKEWKTKYGRETVNSWKQS